MSNTRLQLRFVLEAADYLGMGLVPHPAPFQQHVVNADAVVNLAEVAAVDLEKTSIEVTAREASQLSTLRVLR